MCHIKKKNSKIFSSEGPRENVWEPRENVSPGPTVALDGPVYAYNIRCRPACYADMKV